MFKKMLFNPSLVWWLLKKKFSKIDVLDDSYEWWMDVGMPFISQKEFEKDLFDVDERS